MKNVKERNRTRSFQSIKTNFMQKYVVVMNFREQMSLWWCAIVNNTNLSYIIVKKTI